MKKETEIGLNCTYRLIDGCLVCLEELWNNTHISDNQEQQSLHKQLTFNLMRFDMLTWLCFGQVHANQKRVGELIETAGQAGANIVCLQEAWTMPYALCTREKLPWTQFAENATTGSSVTFLARLAAKHHMVIVSPILERVSQISIQVTTWNKNLLRMKKAAMSCGTPRWWSTTWEMSWARVERTTSQDMATALSQTTIWR